jgi:HK97 family phage major capsid protein
MDGVLIKLETEWEHDGTVYEAGTQLKVNPELAKKLTESAIAKLYDPEAEESARQKAEEELKKLRDIAVVAAKTAVSEVRKELAADNVAKVQVQKPSVDPKGGFDSFAEFAQAVHRRTIGSSHPLAKKLDKYQGQVKTVMQEGEDAQGGFLVPTEFRTELLQTSLEDSVFANRATFIPMQTNHIEIPAVFDTDHRDDPKEFFGGIVVYRPEEGGSKTFSKPHFGLVELNLHEVAGICAVTNNLLEDSPISIGAMLNKLFGQAITWVLDDDTIQGNGVGKPLGILHCDATVEVDKESEQSDDTIVAGNVLSMYARMPAQCLKNAIWLANQTTLPQLAQMTIGNYPVFVPAGGLSQKPFDTLLGKPLFYTEKLPALGDAGDIMFVDPTQYLLGAKRGMSMQTASSIHLYFDMDQTCFRFVMRYDGTCWWKSCMYPKHGDCLSPYVKLGARETL